MTARVVTTTRKELSKQIVNPGTYYYAYNAFKISMNICHFLESLYNHITSVIFLDYILLIFKKEVPRFNFVVNFENNIHIKMVPIHSVSWNLFKAEICLRQDTCTAVSVWLFAPNVLCSVWDDWISILNECIWIICIRLQEKGKKKILKEEELQKTMYLVFFWIRNLCKSITASFLPIS